MPLGINKAFCLFVYVEGLPSLIRWWYYRPA